MNDIKTLKALKNKILSLAMQGKLVKQNENDEPASILLEKIRQEKQNQLENNKKGKGKSKEKPLPPINNEEVPYELPKSWQWVRLGEIGKTQTGTTPSISKDIYLGNYIPFVKPADIQNSKLIFSDYLSKEGLQYGRLIEKKSILMVCIGGSIGKCCYTDVDVSCNQQINTFSYHFKPFKFYFYCLKSEYFQTQIQMKSLGVATPIINKTLWENILVPLPPLAEQERIVAKIEEIFAIIDEVEKNISENKKISKVLYNKILSLAMQGKLVKQNENDEPASILLEKIRQEKQNQLENNKKGKGKSKETPLPPISAEEVPYELPKSWQWVRLVEVCEIFKREKTDNISLPLMDVKYLRTRKNAKIYTSGIVIDKGELIILVDGENSGEVFTVFEKGVLGSTLNILNINQYLYDKYILHILSYHREMFKKSKKGAAIPHLDKNIFNQLVIPLPPLAEQERIVAKIEEIKEIIDEMG